MTRYITATEMDWEQSPVRGGTVMEKCVVWEGEYDVRSAFFRMPKGMDIPQHTHPKWVQVMVLEGALEVDTERDGKRRIEAGECYFVEAGDTHVEAAVEDSVVLVTQGEDREAFQNDE